MPHKKKSAIAIKVDEQEARLDELEQKTKANRKLGVYGFAVMVFFSIVSLIFAGLQFGWLGYELDKSSSTSNIMYWVVYLLVVMIPLAGFFIFRRMNKTADTRRTLDPNQGTLITPGGVIGYDKRDYNYKLPKGNTGKVLRVKTYISENPEKNWEGQVEFENGTFDCWSRDELTKGMQVKIVIREGGEPEVAYDDDLSDLTGVIKKQFGKDGAWLVHFQDQGIFALATSKETLEPGMVVKVVSDTAPGVDVLPFEKEDEEE